MPTTARTLDPGRGDDPSPAGAQRQSRPASPGAALAELFHRHRGTVLAVAPAVVYLAIRGVGLLLLSWLSAANDQSVGENLASWDGEWYLEIAAHGYGGVDPSMVDGRGERHPETPLAFFPGYPLLVRLAPPPAGRRALGRGTARSAPARTAGACGLVRIGHARGGEPPPGPAPPGPVPADGPSDADQPVGAGGGRGRVDSGAPAEDTGPGRLRAEPPHQGASGGESPRTTGRTSWRATVKLPEGAG